MTPLTIITWMPSDNLTDGVASGLMGGVLAAVMSVVFARWITHRISSRKVS